MKHIMTNKNTHIQSAMTQVTGAKPEGPRIWLKILALLGIAASIAWCSVTDTGERCRGSEQAIPPGCVNFHTTPNRITCENTEKGFTGCTTSEVTCFKHWAQQILYTPGNGPDPTRTTNYCADPGPWTYDEPIDTTLESVDNGIICPIPNA